MFRLVQQNQHRGLVSYCPTASDSFRLKGERLHPSRIRRQRHQTPTDLFSLYHNEPRLRRPYRTPRQPESSLQTGGNDGPRLRHDRRDHALLFWVQERQVTRQKDGRYFQTGLRTAFIPRPLRLRHESSQISHQCRWYSQGKRSRHERG